MTNWKTAYCKLYKCLQKLQRESRKMVLRIQRWCQGHAHDNQTIIIACYFLMRFVCHRTMADETEIFAS